jgi:hypothetical protein
MGGGGTCLRTVRMPSMAAGDNRFEGFQPPGYFSLMAALCKAHSGAPLFGYWRASAGRELVAGESALVCKYELVSTGAKEGQIGQMTAGHCRRGIGSDGYLFWIDTIFAAVCLGL